MNDFKQPESEGVPPHIELDPHPEPPKAAFNPYQAPATHGLEPPSPPTWDGATLDPVPWEDHQAIPGMLDRLWATLRMGFTDPFGLSARVSATEPILPAWGFFLLIGVPSLILSLVLSELTTQAMATFFHIPVHRNPGLQMGIAAGSLLLGPFVGGAFLHLFLWMWGGAKEGLGLHQTIRFSCYAHGVYYLVGWIPILNIFLGLVFWVFLAMGLARTHRTDTWRGFAALLTPFILLCCLGIGLAIAMPALLMARH